MNNKIVHILAFLFLVALIITGCDTLVDVDQEVEKTMNIQPLDDSDYSYKKIKNDREHLLTYLKTSVEIIKEAIQDEDFRSELSFAFGEVKKIGNRFDTIAFAELESPKAFYKQKMKKNNENEIASEKVMHAAYRSVRDKNLNLNINFLRRFLMEDRVNLYMPNFEIWDEQEIPTISWHPLDEDEAENIGFKPVKDISGNLIWQEVLVDETYGQTNAVLIVMPGESYSYDPYSIESSDCLIMNSEFESFDLIDDPCYGGGGGYTPPSSSPTAEYAADCSGTDCTEGMEVLIGYVELNNYPCGWFCSGRRIYFGQQFAYYNFIDSPLTVTSAKETRPSVYMKSGDRGNWVRYYTQMESNWAPWQLSKPMTIWVGRGGDWRRALDGLFQVIEVGGDPEQSLSIIYETFLDMTSSDYQRDVFFDAAIDRGNFKASNTTSFGHGTKEGYRIYRVDSGAGSWIRYTFPHQIYIY